MMSQNDVRNRIDQLKLSFDGYSRQLSRPGISAERRERLETSVRLLSEEMATLEKLSQFGRVEPDRDKIEAEVRSRLAVVRERLANDPELAEVAEEDRVFASGELMALQWAVGEDRLMQVTEEWATKMAPNPTRLARSLPPLLAMTVRENPDPQARANAAYDIGQLHIVEAIPALADALADQEDIAETALNALCLFSDRELGAAGLDQDLLERISEVRSARRV